MIESMVPAASTYAADIDNLFSLIFWIVAFWSALTFGVFFWLMWRFRKAASPKAEYLTGDETHPKKLIGRAHMAVLVFDVVILVFAVRVWYDVKQDLPDADRTVRVVAQQWAWSFHHEGPDGRLGTPDDIAMNDELHLEVGQLYHYKLESRDVLHNFSVPVFRLKQDAIPGRVITGWFQPTRTGEYDIQCAEICGIGHGLMPARVVIESAAEHAAWMQSHSSVAIAAATVEE
jgi:cytochrome c oxidase subunit 2